MTDKENVIREIAKEYRDGQSSAKIKPPCVKCTDVKIYVCTQLGKSCRAFRVYVEGTSPTAPDRAKPAGPGGRKVVIL